AVLRTARAQIHQGVGALELVGLPAAATVLRASEAAVQRSIARPQSLTPELVADIEHASFGLVDFLTRLLAGKKISPLALFPQYRAVQETVDAERIHPADLWPLDWRWREVDATNETVAPRPADAMTGAQLENQLLALMRGTQALTAAARMSELCAGLAAGATDPQVRIFWQLAAAFFEAQHNGLLPFDVFTKRVASRLLAQFRILLRGDFDVSERLARDLLFFCAQAAVPARGSRLPRLAAVRSAYGLPDDEPTDYAISALGRFDPAIVAHAKKRVVAAKEAWSATAGNELHRLSGLAEQFSLVGDSLRKLFPFGESFASELQSAVAQTQAAQAAPPPPLAMEVATSLLYIEAELEDGDFDNPAHADRVKRLGERLAGVRAGRAPEPLEPWMEELYRRVSDRQTMGSVVQELRASLGEVEKAIDQFFRDPREKNVLIDVPVQFGAMRGVLSVLGMDHAAQALLRMRDEVDGLISTELDQERVGRPSVFDHLAANLSALGFLIDMLSVQPQMAKSLFKFDPETGSLAPVMGRSVVANAARPVEPRLVEQVQLLAFTAVREDVPLQDVSRDLDRLSQEAQAADQPALAAAVLKAQEAIGRAEDEAGISTARGELSEALVDFVASTTEPVGLGPLSQPAPLDAIRTISVVGDLEHDDEMREVFLEEAREVIENARQACAQLNDAPDELSLLTTLRRAFHTLKGSSRMVGLTAFGEAAWAGEQVFNTQLAEQRAAEPALIEFSEWVLGYLLHWVDDISAKRDADRNEGEVKVAVDRLTRRLDNAETSDIELPLGLPPGLPSRADLELRPAAEPSPVDEPPAEVSFELDLSGLDGGPHGEAVAGLGTGEGADPAAMYRPFDASSPPTQPMPVDELPSFEPSGPVDLDLGQPSDHVPLIQSLSPSGSPAVAEGSVAETDSALPSGDDEHVKVVGHLRIGIPLFNIYLNEADELSRRLMTEVSEWAMELHRPVGEGAIALAHSLAGSSSTVGFADLSQLARSLEHALARAQVIGSGTDEEAKLFVDAAEEIRRLLHQFAAGFLHQPDAALLSRLAEHERSSAIRLEAATAASEMEDETSTTQGPSVGVDSLLSLDLADPPDTLTGRDSQRTQSGWLETGAG
ncbi:MAG: Hpt domain-containing protein, partial [Pseudomonadota bacterium]|nr:Hpt domain-containing protein [Pseudomonadota bacterium]